LLYLGNDNKYQNGLEENLTLEALKIIEVIMPYQPVLSKKA